MRINHILFFLGLFFLAACGKNNTPDDIIPRDRMVGLLTQVHLIDGGLANLSQTPDTLYKHGMAKYLHLFETYHTDTAQFKKSVIYYAIRSEIYDQMYDEIVKSLNAKQDSLNKARSAVYKIDSAKNAQRQQHLADSIKKADGHLPNKVDTGYKSRQIQDRLIKKGAQNN